MNADMQPRDTDTGAEFFWIVAAFILMLAGPALVIAAWRWAL